MMMKAISKLFVLQGYQVYYTYLGVTYYSAVAKRGLGR